jgi:hypothetical protein
MFWLRNRQRQYWQAKAEAFDVAAALDANERLHHAGD